MDNTFRYSSDIYQAFISRDGLTITLPVPMGSFLWEVEMDCDHACKKDNEHFRIAFGNGPKNCKRHIDTACSATFIGIRRIKLDIDNVGKVLRRYEITIFKDKEKAIEAGERLQQSRVEIMKKSGMHVDEFGKFTE